MGLESLFNDICIELGIVAHYKEEPGGFFWHGEALTGERTDPNTHLMTASYQRVEQQPSGTKSEVASFQQQDRSEILISATYIGSEPKSYLVQMRVPVEHYQEELAKMEKQCSHGDSLSTAADLLYSMLRVRGTAGMEPGDLVDVKTTVTALDDLKEFICNHIR